MLLLVLCVECDIKHLEKAKILLYNFDFNLINIELK